MSTPLTRILDGGLIEGLQAVLEYNADNILREPLLMSDYQLDQGGALEFS